MTTSMLYNQNTIKHLTQNVCRNHHVDLLIHCGLSYSDIDEKLTKIYDQKCNINMQSRNKILIRNIKIMDNNEELAAINALMKLKYSSIECDIIEYKCEEIL